MDHAWVTAFMNAVGIEWVMPGLLPSWMQWVWNGSCLGYCIHECCGYGMGHAWVTAFMNAVGMEWVTPGLLHS